MADTGICVVWSLQNETADHTEQSGFFSLYPDQDLEETLWDAIEEQNLHAQLQAEFQITRPLWYGLWLGSPLSRRQSTVLYKLFSDVAGQSLLYRRELRPFLAALHHASEGRGQLNVRLTPPGHTDFGMLTTFAHCPRCKAEAPFPRWQDYPSEQIACPVCNHEFSPTATHSSREYHVKGTEAEKHKGRQLGSVTLMWLMGWMLIKELVVTPSLEAIARRHRRRRAKRRKRHE